MLPSQVDSGRVIRRFTQRIQAPPERVFPLLCPVREAEWLDGWAERVEIVHSDSGLVEEGCVFRTRAPGRPETVWVVSRHDPAAGAVEFVRVTTGLLATRLAIGVSEDGGASRVEIEYTFTPLGEAGRAELESSFSAEAFARDLRWWEESMNHWLATGERLRAPAA
jgi:Polyketide cyclase / dehydrase and lipid transport